MRRAFYSSTVRLVTVLEPSADLNGRGAAPDLGHFRNNDTRFVKFQKLSNPTVEAFICMQSAAICSSIGCSLASSYPHSKALLAAGAPNLCTSSRYVLFTPVWVRPCLVPSHLRVPQPAGAATACSRRGALLAEKSMNDWTFSSSLFLPWPLFSPRRLRDRWRCPLSCKCASTRARARSSPCSRSRVHAQPTPDTLTKRSPKGTLRLIRVVPISR